MSHKITLFQNIFTSEITEQDEFTFKDFDELHAVFIDMSKESYSHKGADGHYLFIGTTFDSDKDGIKRRQKAFANPSNLLVMDFDDKNADTPVAAVMGVLDGMACDYVCYTSASYTNQYQKCRVVIPLKRAVCAGEYEVLSEQIDKVFDKAGILPDASANRLSQPQYLPMTNTSTGYECQIWRSSCHKPLDVESYMSVDYNGKVYNLYDLKLRQEQAKKIRRMEYMALQSSMSKCADIPYFNNISDNNILGKQATANLISIMSSEQRGPLMPSAACSIVSSAYAKFGYGAVSDVILESALEYVGGNTTHNRYDKLIAGAVSRFNGGC